MARWIRSSSRSVLSAVIAVVVTFSFAQQAFAADQKPAAADLEAKAAEAKARALFKEGQTAYDVGEFKTALEKYTEAYKVKPLPGFLFNIAQCHRQLGDYKLAGFFFSRFIDTSKPEAPNIELARTLLEEATRKQTEAEAAAKASTTQRDTPLKTPALTDVGSTTTNPVLPPPPPPPAVEETPVWKKGWFWAVVGGGVLVVAGGVTAGVVASQPRVITYTPTPTTLNDINAR